MNPYQLLGIQPSATEAEIKKAFRSQAKKCHPDINKDPQASEIFRKLTEAQKLALASVGKTKSKPKINIQVTNTVFRVLYRQNQDGTWTIGYPDTYIEKDTRLVFMDNMKEFNVTIDYDIQLPATLKVTAQEEYIIKVIPQCN